MEISYAGKTVLVTGGARGIGWNIAQKFSENGANVVIADCNEGLHRAGSGDVFRPNGTITFHKIDLRQTVELREMVLKIRREYGSIDVLINNARGGKRTEPLNETEENFTESVNVSLKAPMILSQIMIEEKTAEENGACIINMSSVAAETVCGESTAYHLTKAGIKSLTRYLAAYGGAKDVRVNAISPGFVVQDEHHRKYYGNDNKKYRKAVELCHPLGRAGRSDDIANVALILASTYSSFITGQIITVDGGLSLTGQWEIARKALANFENE